MTPALNVEVCYSQSPRTSAGEIRLPRCRLSTHGHSRPARTIALLVQFVAVALAGCGSESGALGGQQECVVSGDVFIVTRGGVNYKLGLVRVEAIPDSSIERFLILAGEQQVLAARARDSLIAVKERALGAARGSEQAGFDSHERLAAMNRAEDGSVSQAALDQAWNRAQAARGRQSQLRGEIQRLKAQGPEFLTPDYYFDHLPPSVAAAKSDADGKFELRIPHEGRFALAAQSTRDVGFGQESYHWLVWIEAKAGAPTKVMLSNDNLLTTPSSESVVLASEGGLSPDSFRR